MGITPSFLLLLFFSITCQHVTSQNLLWSRNIPLLQGRDAASTGSQGISSLMLTKDKGKEVLLVFADNTQKESDSRIQIVQIETDSAKVISSFALNRSSVLNRPYDPFRFYPELTGAFYGNDSSTLFLMANGGPTSRQTIFIWQLDIKKMVLKWERSLIQGSALQLSGRYLADNSSFSDRLIVSATAEFVGNERTSYKGYTLDLDPNTGGIVRDAEIKLPEEQNGTILAAGSKVFSDKEMFFCTLVSNENSTNFYVDLIVDKTTKLWGANESLTEVLPRSLSETKPLIAGSIGNVAMNASSSKAYFMVAGVYFDQESQNFDTILRQALVEVDMEKKNVTDVLDVEKNTNGSRLFSAGESGSMLYLSGTTSTKDAVCKEEPKEKQEALILFAKKPNSTFSSLSNVARILVENRTITHLRVEPAMVNESFFLLAGHKVEGSTNVNFTLFKMKDFDKSVSEKKKSCVSVNNNGTARESLLSTEKDTTTNTPSPTASPSSSGSSDKKECFPAAAKIEVENEGSRSMREISHGARVHVGRGAFSTIYCFSHRLEESERDFYFLRLITDSERGPSLTLTAGHYVHVRGKSIIPAGEVRLGDELIKGDGSTAKVVQIRNVREKGLYNPHTMHGDLIVDGFLVSTYTTAVPPRFAHALLAPVRWTYRLLGKDAGPLQLVERILNRSP